MTDTKLTNDQLSDMSPWDIARHYGIGFSGDMNPLQHGGYFFSLSNWDDYGYAECVEFWEDPETHALVVQTGTIHKLEDKELEGAFRCIGIDADDPIRAQPLCQIDACKSYAGMEPDGTAYPYLKVFDLDTWKERNIWKSIRGWIEGLAS